MSQRDDAVEDFEEWLAQMSPETVAFLLAGPGGSTGGETDG